MFKITAGILAGIILGSGGAAVAAGAFSPPPTPDWMNNRPCATPDHYYTTNCYWNEDQMGGGSVPNHFVHNYTVWQEDGTKAVLRCYTYTKPDAIYHPDHCVTRNPAFSLQVKR